VLCRQPVSFAPEGSSFREKKRSLVGDWGESNALKERGSRKRAAAQRLVCKGTQKKEPGLQPGYTSRGKGTQKSNAVRPDEGEEGRIPNSHSCKKKKRGERKTRAKWGEDGENGVYSSGQGAVHGLNDVRGPKTKKEDVTRMR